MKVFLAFASVFFASSAFAQESIKYPQWEVTNLAEAYNECGHNGASQAGIYDTKTFTVDNFIKELRKKDGGCARKYSKSSADAVRKYNSHLSGNKKLDPFSEYTKSCVDKNIPPDQSENLQNLINAKDTRAVVANVYDYHNRLKTDASESCAYYQFYVFKNSGSVLKIEFNYTD